MNRKIQIAICTNLFLIFAISGIHAQESAPKEPEIKFKHAIGAGAGFTIGYGLLYRYMPKRFGVQIAFAPYHDKQKDIYSTGLTFMYTMIETKVANLFLYQGNHFYYNSQTYATYFYDPNQPGPVQSTGTTRTTDAYVNNGFGFGFEFIIVKRLGFNLMTGYAFYHNFEQINFTGETELYYKF